MPSAPLTPAEAKAEPGPELAEPSQDGSEGDTLESRLAEVQDDKLLALFPGLAKPRKVVAAARGGGSLLVLLKQLILLEEVKRSGGNPDNLGEWRRQRWLSRVQQSFINQRRRFERASYYQLNLPDEGIAMELYLQLCNGEVSFPQLLARYHPPRPGKKQIGVISEKPMRKLPPALVKKLRRSTPGQPMAPLSLGQSQTLFQLIEWHEPVLDEATHALLEKEVEDGWLSDELHRRFDVPLAAEPTPAAVSA